LLTVGDSIASVCRRRRLSAGNVLWLNGVS